MTRENHNYNILLYVIFYFIFLSNENDGKKSLFAQKQKSKIDCICITWSGATLVVTGLIIRNKSLKDKGNFLNFDGLGYAYTGWITMLSSIPFFAWSSKNKRKTVEITYINQKLTTAKSNVIAFKSQPALAIIVNF